MGVNTVELINRSGSVTREAKSPISDQGAADQTMQDLKPLSEQAAHAALWRKHLETKDTRRDLIKKGLEIGGIAAIASIGGAKIATESSILPQLLGTPITENATQTTKQDTLVKNGESIKISLGKEGSIVATLDGWEPTFQVGQVIDALEHDGLKTATFEAVYSNAIVEEIPSFTVNTGAKSIEDSVTLSKNASLGSADGSDVAMLHLVPLGENNNVQINIKTDSGETLLPLTFQLDSQSYTNRPDQKQRVFAEIGDGTDELTPEKDLLQIDYDAEAMGILGVDAQVYISRNPHLGEIHYRTDGTMGMGVTVKKEAFNKDRPYESYGQMLAFHQMARNAVEKLTNEEVHSRYVIPQITDQLNEANRVKVQLDGSLSARKSGKNIEEREEKPNILDINYFFPDFDGDLTYYNDGEPTKSETKILGGISEQLISVMDILRFVDIDDFSEAFSLLQPEQKKNLALVVSHCLEALKRATEDRGSLEKLFPSLPHYKDAISLYSS